MVSLTAKEDILDLWAEGLTPTLEDIVRLNALGLVAERVPNPAESVYACRRCAFLGDIVLKEPVLAHEVFEDKVRGLIDVSDVLTVLALKAYLCITPPSALPQPTAAEVKAAVEKAISVFSGCTRNQIAAAVLYVTAGRDWRHGEIPAARADGSDELVDPEAYSSPVGIVLNGVAIGVGLTLKEAFNLPRRQFNAMVERRMRYDGAIDKKAAKRAAEDDYDRTFDEIKARLKAEKSEK